MKRTGLILLSFSLAAPALAQTSTPAAQYQPNSSNVAQQFKTGANHVGNGAEQIGEGIKQGAILTWHALEAGAASTAATFDGIQSRSTSN